MTMALSDQARRANCTWPQFLTFDKSPLDRNPSNNSGSIISATPNSHLSVIRLRFQRMCSVWAHLDLSHGNFSAQFISQGVTIEY